MVSHADLRLLQSHQSTSYTGTSYTGTSYTGTSYTGTSYTGMNRLLRRSQMTYIAVGFGFGLIVLCLMAFNDSTIMVGSYRAIAPSTVTSIRQKGLSSHPAVPAVPAVAAKVFSANTISSTYPGHVLPDATQLKDQILADLTSRLIEGATQDSPAREIPIESHIPQGTTLSWNNSWLLPCLAMIGAWLTWQVRRYKRNSYRTIPCDIEALQHNPPLAMMATEGKEEAEGEAVQKEGRKHFIREIIKRDLAAGKYERLQTRFPPEPNGFLHIGHAKSICLNFGLAWEFDGSANFRFDDTNPAKEDKIYLVQGCKDVKWLLDRGENPWNGCVRYTSDYFDDLYGVAVYLIIAGKAYVDEQTPEEIRMNRGTLTEPGIDSPYRDRTTQENAALFQKMFKGEVEDGKMVLRLKIDMRSPNINMRDPVIYRVKRNEHHPRVRNQWSVYPMYDFGHCISDALEGITHSLCTLEFEDHRPLYDWILKAVAETSGMDHILQKMPKTLPQQIEFSRLNVQYTILSKRKLKRLVDEEHVSGWDDPRMPTLSGIRRRGVPPAALWSFCEAVGISKIDSNIDPEILDQCTRDVLENTATRAFAVIDPLKITITSWPENVTQTCEVPEGYAGKSLEFGRNIIVESSDFQLNPEKGWRRLEPGGRVRLRYAYVIVCDEVIEKDGKVVELKCHHLEETFQGQKPAEGPKVKGIIHWLPDDPTTSASADVILYDRLFLTPNPGADDPEGDFVPDLNPNSAVRTKARVEPALLDANPGDTFQFERLGFFCADLVDSVAPSKGEYGKYIPGIPVFNRVVPLKDGFKKESKPSKGEGKPKQQTKAAPTPGGADVEDIRRLDMRVGTILSAERHPDADSLYVEQIDVGDPDGPRTVVSGLAKYFDDPEMLLGKKVVVVCNLKPAKMRGIESAGMVLAASKGEEGEAVVELLQPPSESTPGTQVYADGFDPPSPDPVLKSKTAQKVFPRVAEDLKTNSEKIATYADKPLMTEFGPCAVATLEGASIR